MFKGLFEHIKGPFERPKGPFENCQSALWNIQRTLWKMKGALWKQQKAICNLQNTIQKMVVLYLCCTPKSLFQNFKPSLLYILYGWRSLPSGYSKETFESYCTVLYRVRCELSAKPCQHLEGETRIYMFRKPFWECRKALWNLKRAFEELPRHVFICTKASQTLSTDLKFKELETMTLLYCAAMQWAGARARLQRKGVLHDIVWYIMLNCSSTV